MPKAIEMGQRTEDGRPGTEERAMKDFTILFMTGKCREMNCYFNLSIKPIIKK
jgi:hypothetical protein